MDNTNDKIFFNFSYFALKLLGKGLYSNPWTAIAELVANGLDAKATCVRIFIDMSDKKNSEIEIFDNGTGMTYSDLAERKLVTLRVAMPPADIVHVGHCQSHFIFQTIHLALGLVQALAH